MWKVTLVRLSLGRRVRQKRQNELECVGENGGSLRRCFVTSRVQFLNFGFRSEISLSANVADCQIWARGENRVSLRAQNL
jgi:hypothetical protein